MNFFCRAIFAADSKIEYKRITAIPKRNLFGTVVFLRIFFIPFLIQIDFRRVCAARFFGISGILHRKINPFSLLFRSMTNRGICGILEHDGRHQRDAKTV